MDLKIGDVVKLKSGGPDMTVEYELDSSSLSVSCVWFDGKTPKRDSFPAESLTKAF